MDLCRNQVEGKIHSDEFSTTIFYYNTRINLHVIQMKTYDDSNWREELIPYTNSKKELELLENGPKSLAQSWHMSALHNKWKKIKGYKDPEPPDVSSSMKEYFEKEQEFLTEDDL